ncbi:MAG: hypothetical protein KF746_28105, partial [Chitinophagaceae bacterium]|nr:hypothetical protein [Chitinophagaceae bacterium]
IVESQSCKELGTPKPHYLIFWEGKGNGNLQMQKFMQDYFLVLQAIMSGWLIAHIHRGERGRIKKAPEGALFNFMRPAFVLFFSA